MTGPVMATAVPQLLLTGGGEGVVALAIQATVEPPAAGGVNVGGLIVYV
jgi:hypothetical protein